MQRCARTIWRNAWRCETSRLLRQYGAGRTISTESDQAKKVIFSGIQPTGVPHLGNYLGALRQWVRLQDEAVPSTRLIFSLVDLHAITIRQDAEQLRAWKRESLAMLLAIGLDPQRSTIFHQSDVSAHAELMWILTCQASTGHLERMTQWKDKTNRGKDQERVKLGLFSYPVLQAADVLVHRASHVPVGEDQAQHLELTRDLADNFNHHFGGGVLLRPETMISPAARIMSLTEPNKKMSKSSRDVKSRILLTDSEEVIKSKFKSALTDSLPGIQYRPEERPGVSGLIDIIYHTDPAYEGVPSVDQGAIARDLEGASLRALKDKAADSVNNVVKPIREQYADLISNEKLLGQVAAEGAAKAEESAAPTLAAVKRAVGLL